MAGHSAARWLLSRARPKGADRPTFAYLLCSFLTIPSKFHHLTAKFRSQNRVQELGQPHFDVSINPEAAGMRRQAPGDNAQD